MSDESKFDETSLPPKEAFYNDLKNECVSDADYEHACRVFRELKVPNLGYYSSLYLLTDVLLLASVFENFRDICLKDYRLDACHYYSAPGLSFAAMLSQTKVKLELLKDVDQLQMFTRGIRGGMSMVCHRYAAANNPYMQQFDPEKPISYIQYLDANNLYGWAMMQKLPMSNFRFLEERELQLFDIKNVDLEGDKGYLLEVSLSYPIHLHEEHNCFPVAPEKQRVEDAMLSPFASQLWQDLHGKRCKRLQDEKLLNTLYDKDKYVLHCRNLKLYVSLGLEIKRIHRVLEFHQSDWMKNYIDFNTKKRAQAKTSFEKSFYKIMNCSVFGKLMENQKKHRDIRLVTSENKLKKMVSKPTFHSRKILNDCLVGVEHKRVKVKITKPIYAGQAVLDISKCLMYDFFYNYLKKKYGDSCKLLMTDTDSLLFHVETKNVYADMRENAHLFDRSDYPENHFFRSEVNKKVPGKFKDEMNSKIIKAFTGLRSKMYAFKTEEEEEEKKAKGVSKFCVDKDLRYRMYKDTLFEGKELLSDMNLIRSHCHELYVENVRKKSLSCFDDKRFLIDGIESLAYGHYFSALYYT